MKFACLPVVIPAAACLCACSSIETHKLTAEASKSHPESQRGLVYYLPRKDVVVTVTIENGKVKTLDATASAVYADTEAPYVLQFGGNAVAQNTLHITTDENGVLSTAQTSSEPQIEAALAVYAGLKVPAAAVPQAVAPAAKAQCNSGTYAIAYDVASPPSQVNFICDAVVTIERARGAAPLDFLPTVGTETSGIYYRQNLPYRVRLRSDQGGLGIDKIILSPTQSPPIFLPIRKNFFAKSSSQLTIKDGVVTDYQQQSDGEVTAALKLPADILSAYFGAIGAVFSGFSDRDSKEAAKLNAETQLQLAKQKHDACSDAIAKKASADDLKALGCTN